MSMHISHFNPNDPAPKKSGVFGTPLYTAEQSKIILIPVPWEATTSYGKGTSRGPKAIFKASMQVDLYDLYLGSFYEKGIFFLDEDEKIVELNLKSIDSAPNEINEYSERVNDIVYYETLKWLKKGKIIGIVGGEHSSSFGAIKALSDYHIGLGILQIDAHADLRKNFEDYKFSHASVMYNIVKELNINNLVQIGVRDFSNEEFIFLKKNSKKIKTFFEQKIRENLYQGQSWNCICDQIIAELPDKIYISFDIDGLDPKLCPNTGTPVPGGFNFQEIEFLLMKLVHAGKKIIGFDLSEVSPADNNELDANVGARALFKLCGWALKSQEY